MFPLKVRYSKTLKEQINPDQIPDFLNISRDLLSKAGADYFSIENNCLKFDNKLFKLTSSWNLMAPIDAGFVEIKTDKNNNVKISYGIKMISIWIFVTFFGIIFWILNNDIKDFLVIFGGLGGLNWVTAVYRHKGFFSDITDSIIYNISKNKE